MITGVRSLPFSIDWLPDGPMLITSGQTLLRMAPDGSLETHVDLRDLSQHGWNEIVVDGRGNAYVNNICFDFMSGAEFAPGIIALVTPDGSVRQVADGIAFPNGMVVTPDNSTLIVAESFAGRLPRSTSQPTAACRTGACGPIWARVATGSASTPREPSGPPR